MSALYQVSVNALEDPTTVLLDVQVTHPDSMYVSDDVGFALMLIWEAADESPLAAEIGDAILNPTWAKRQVRGFIQRAEIVGLRDEPSPSVLADEADPYWQNSSRWLSGTVRITVTDAAWISHLKTGQVWASTAFELAEGYAKCGPILFGVEADESETTDSEEDGLLPIPRLFFLDLFDEMETPIVWVPKYPKSAYTAVNKVKDGEVTKELLESWKGKAVLFKKLKEVGVLVGPKKFVSFSELSWGASGRGGNVVALAKFNPKKKNVAEPLTIKGLARVTKPVITRADVDGCQASLTVSCFDSGRRLALNHHAEVLKLLADGECDSAWRFAKATSKLGVTLHREYVERGLHGEDDLYAQLANGIIVEAKMKRTKKGATNLDTLSSKEAAKAMMSNPWDEWRIDITVSDPAWLEHLAEVTPFSYGFFLCSKARPWDGDPLVYLGP